MKKLTAVLKALLSDPKNDVKKIKTQLGDLEKELKKIEAMPNKVEAIVRLFQVISPIQDAGGFTTTIYQLQKKNYGQLDETLEALFILQKHFHNAGRSEYGINRTAKGEEVTADKVYLGNVFGVWTKTATYWLANQEELKKDFRDDLTKNPERPVTTWYCINDHQSGGFVKSHVEGILEQIEVLKLVA